MDSDAFGGAEVYARHLLDHAHQHGWRASLVCSAPVSEHFAGADPAVRVAVVPSTRRAPSAPGTRAALMGQRPDLVLVNLVDPTSNAAALEAALSVAPTAATLHLKGHPQAGPSRDAVLRMRRLMPGLRLAFTPASDARAQLVEDLGTPPDRVVVVANGVDPPPLVRRRSSRRPPRIGALGRLTDQKGFDVLIESVRLLHRRGAPAQLLIGGEGRDRAALEDRARGLPVTMPGFVPDVPEFLAEVHLFCLASRREALPLALLEAMGAGLPCVATDVGDVRAALGSAVLVVPPDDPEALADALGCLLDRPRQADDLGRRARALVLKRFDRSVMAARTFSALRSALDAPRRGPDPA